MKFNTFDNKRFYERIIQSDNESAVEVRYEDAYLDIVGDLTVSKKGFGKRGRTDGVMKLTYEGHTILGIQEVKFNKCKSEWQLTQQLIQACMYEWLGHDHYDFFVVNSEKQFAYIFPKEFEQLKKELFKAFETTEYSPSDAYKDKHIQSIVRGKIKFKNNYAINKDIKMENILKELYTQCLNTLI